MSDAAARPFTPADFQSWEMVQTERWELIDGRPRLKPDAGPTHTAIGDNLTAALRRRLRRDGVVLQDRFRLRVGACLLYPDVMLICPSPGPGATLAEQATAVVEIVATHNSHSYYQRKLMRYLQTPELHAYLTVSAVDAAATCYHKQGDSWAVTLAAGLDAVVALESLALTLPLAEIYAGVDLSGDPLRS